MTTEQRLKSYEPIFGKWKLDSLIGVGSFGTVYSIYREEMGVKYMAALKVISVPKDQMDVNQMYNLYGNNSRQIEEHYQETVNAIYREIQIMERLKGNSNIVCFEDNDLIRREDVDCGWDVLIRMELLMQLNVYLRERRATQREIIRMWYEITQALVLCGRENILHRDIKPENIFVSQNDYFKLGDFGIAKQTKGETAGTVAGSYPYMAPEVRTRRGGDCRIDIYSLGMVVYELLNANRLPFYPAYPALVKLEDKEQAMEKRWSGKEPVPPIPGLNPKIWEILRKSLTFDPRNRYQDAAELRNALNGVLNLEELNEIRHFDHNGDPIPPPWGRLEGKGPGSRRISLPIAAAVALTACAALLVWMGLRSRLSSVSAPTAAPVEMVLPSPEAEQTGAEPMIIPEITPEATSEGIPESTSETTPEAAPEVTRPPRVADNKPTTAFSFVQEDGGTRYLGYQAGSFSDDIGITATVDGQEVSSVAFLESPVLLPRALPGYYMILPEPEEPDPSRTYAFKVQWSTPDGESGVLAEESYHWKKTATGFEPRLGRARTPITVSVHPEPSGGVVNAQAGSIEFSGEAEPNTILTLTMNGNKYQAAADADGRWSAPFALTEFTPDMVYSVEAAYEDGDGVAARMGAFQYDAGCALALDGEIRAGAGSVSGTTDPLAEVTLTRDGIEIGRASANEDGAWSMDIGSAGLQEGQALVLSATDPAGNTHAVSIMVGESVFSRITLSVDGVEEGGTLTGVASRVTVNGKATADETLRVALYSGTEAIAEQPTKAGEGGVWSASFDLTPAAEPVALRLTAGYSGREDAGLGASLSFTYDPLCVLAVQGLTEDASGASGTADRGARVTATHSGAPLGEVEADSDGRWNISWGAGSLRAGDVVEFRAVDSAGNMDEDSATAAQEKRRNATISMLPAPINGAVGDVGSIVFSGAAEPGEHLVLNVNDTAQFIECGPNGQWSAFVWTNQLPERMPVTASIAYEDGSGEGASKTFVYDASCLLTVDGTLDEATTALHGTADPLATVTLRAEGMSPRNVAAGASGEWALDLTGAALEVGQTVTVIARDTVGNQASREMTVAPAPSEASQATPPPTPGEAASTQNPWDAIGGLIAGEITPTPRQEVTIDSKSMRTAGVNKVTEWGGTAAAGAVLAVELRGISDGTFQSQAVADVNGRWTASFIVDPNAAGSLTLTARYADDPDGSLGATATLYDARCDLTVDHGLNADSPSLSGTADGGAVVAAYRDNAEIGRVTAGEDGAWQMPLTDASLREGQQIRVTATDASGNIAPEAILNVERAERAEIWFDASEGVNGAGYLTAQEVKLRGTASANKEIAITARLGDETWTKSAPVDGNGDWSASVPFVNGTLPGELNVVARYADGVRDDIRAEKQIPCDGGCQLAVTAIPTESSPSIGGTADPGAVVSVYHAGETELLTAKDAGPEGGWTLDLSGTGLKAGLALRIEAEDQAGNAAQPVDLEVGAPELAKITLSTSGSVNENGYVTGQELRLKGTATPGYAVEITVDKSAPKRAMTDETGEWEASLPIENAASPGTISITVAYADSDRADLKAEQEIKRDGGCDLNVLMQPTPDDPRVTGTADPGASLQAIVSGRGQASATDTADERGDWELDLSDAGLQVGDEVRITATDPAGNSRVQAAKVGEPVRLPITIDRPNGEETVQLNRASGAAAMEGRATPNSSIDLIMDGSVVNTVQADSGGRWSGTILVERFPGNASTGVTAAYSDGYGQGASTKDGQFYYDPACALRVEDVREGAERVLGTSDPGARVALFRGEVSLGEGDADGAGKWEIALTGGEPLKAGEELLVRATDGAGNTAERNVRVLEAEREAIALVSDWPEGLIAAENGSITLRGTASAGKAVRVALRDSINGAQIDDQEEPNEQGAWSAVLSANEFQDGDQVELTLEYADGVAQAKGIRGMFAIDASAPELTVEETRPLEGDVTVRGTAEPGAEVYLEDGQGNAVGGSPVIADEAGRFAFSAMRCAAHEKFTVFAADAVRHRSDPDYVTVRSTLPYRKADVALDAADYQPDSELRVNGFVLCDPADVFRIAIVPAESQGDFDSAVNQHKVGESEMTPMSQDQIDAENQKFAGQVDGLYGVDLRASIGIFEDVAPGEYVLMLAYQEGGKGEREMLATLPFTVGGGASASNRFVSPDGRFAVEYDSHSGAFSPDEVVLTGWVYSAQPLNTDATLLVTGAGDDPNNGGSVPLNAISSSEAASLASEASRPAVGEGTICFVPDTSASRNVEGLTSGGGWSRFALIMRLDSGEYPDDAYDVYLLLSAMDDEPTAFARVTIKEGAPGGAAESAVEMLGAIAPTLPAATPEPAVTPEPTATPSPYETLKKGLKKNEQVKNMQGRLYELGWFDGARDGNFGPATESAVKKFQKAAGMKEDGVATAEVQARLFADDAPRGG